jgi:methylmalonyl-CoA/ethylmalonyl-CoA epimerase
VFAFHHMGIAVSSVEDAVPVYQQLFGYQILSGPFVDPIQRVRVCFVGTKTGPDAVVELVAPEGPDSPIGTVLLKGIGVYHVCYEVKALEPALVHVRANGCVIVANAVPAVAFGGRRVAWFYMPTRQLVELLEEV